MKALVAFFSAGGRTRRVALRLAEAIGAPVYEIRPKVPYTSADLNWMNRRSRSSLEMKDPDKVGRIVNFGTAALLNSTWKKVKAEAEKKGIAMDEREFHCRGEFKGMHKGRPNKKDLEEAAAFVRSVISE